MDIIAEVSQHAFRILLTIYIHALKIKQAFH